MEQHDSNGGKGGTRTLDPGIMSSWHEVTCKFNSLPGAPVAIGTTKHDWAPPIPAKLPQESVRTLGDLM